MHGGAAHIAFGAGDGLGLRDFRAFAAQYPTPHNCCVRFVAAVAGGPRNTRYRAAANLTRTGLSPAGSEQLILTHPQVSGRSRLERYKFQNFVKEIYFDSDTKIGLLSGAPFDDPSKWLLIE